MDKLTDEQIMREIAKLQSEIATCLHTKESLMQGKQLMQHKLLAPYAEHFDAEATKLFQSAYDDAVNAGKDAFFFGEDHPQEVEVGFAKHLLDYLRLRKVENN